MYATIVAALAALAVAAPTESPLETRQTAINDGQILNYALTLEHLENAFYKLGLATFSSADFCKAGADKDFYANLQEIAKDEQTHVTFLSGALTGAGVTPVQPCTYSFGAKDAATFLAIANVLEGVGTSAYLGAARFIANKDYLTAAGSILTVEARHSAYLRSQQSPTQSGFPAAFDIPLTFNEVYSLAAQFITSCPQNNPKLPVKAFPVLTVTSTGAYKAGDKITLTTKANVGAKNAFFISASGPVTAPITISGTKYTVTVPAGASPGQEYLVLTKDGNAPSDDNIVAGPAVIQIKDNLSSRNYNGHNNGGH